MYIIGKIIFVTKSVPMIKKQVFAPTEVLHRQRGGRDITSEYVQSLGYDNIEFTRDVYDTKGIICSSILVPNPKFDMIFCHGNGQDVVNTLSTDPVRGLVFDNTREIMSIVANALSANIILVEYPGYASVNTEPSEEGCYDAAWAVLKCKLLEYEKNKSADEPRPLVICGYSLGCSIAISCAARLCQTPSMMAYSLRTRLLLLAPFVSAISSVVPWYFAKLLSPVDMFKTDVAHHITFPVYIIHGDQDAVIPSSNASVLIGKFNDMEMRQNKVRIVEGMDHEMFSSRHLKETIAEIRYYIEYILLL